MAAAAPSCHVVSPRGLHSTTAVRDTRYATLTDKDVSFFKSVLGDNAVIQDPHELEPMNYDWMKNWKGTSSLALKPASTEEVSTILKYCNERKLAVVPQSGNTGLVGGGVPLFDEIILSMSRMNRIMELDQYKGAVVCEAGVVLETLQNHLEDNGFTMPLDLGAKGSCMIGGNAATNAGGIRFLRYGSLHGNILGIEAVLPDGTVLDNMSGLRKDNTGYDLKQLFIGSEGTLGVITKLVVQVPAKPKAVNLAFMGLPSFDNVLECLRSVRGSLGEVLSAVEFLDRGALDLVLKHLVGTRDPLPTPHPFYMLVETSGSHAEHDQEKFMLCMEEVMEAGIVSDGALAQDETQIKDTWKLREGIAEALLHAGVVYKYDVSVPATHMYTLVEAMKERLADIPDTKVVGYGHVGDENLHLNVSAPQHDDKIFNRIEPFLFDRVAEVRGSVSAEHGIGQCKVNYLPYSKSEAMISTMRGIKNLFDPNGILNPYKVLPPVS